MPRSTAPIVIIGAGFAGLGMAIRLQQAGIRQFTIYEADDGVGGTWRANHYPGAACDVPSHLYSFSFEPNPNWSRAYAPQAEILRYLEHCTDKYGLRPHLRCNTAVTALRFDEASGEWAVSLSNGDTVRASVVVSGSGGLSRPAYPDIPGLPQFAGKLFHSARWRHDYDLRDKIVAVIGTGASAIQFVPQIASQVRLLQLFQRTPPWVLPRPDRAITALERGLFRALPPLQWLYRQTQYWINESRVLGFIRHPRFMALIGWLGRRHIRQQIADPALRQRVTPTYTPGCKRILISNDYYPALNRDNVQLNSQHIDHIDASSIHTADGRRHPVDAIILGTGFQAAEAVAPFPVVGLAGRDLNHSWRNGAEAYLGTSVNGFPNLYFIVGPNTGLGHSSMVLMIESQIRYILSALAQQKQGGFRYLDVKAEVQASFNRRLTDKLAKTVWATGCSSWYQTSSGKNTTLWPSSTLAFRYLTRRLALADYRTVAGRPATRATPPFPAPIEEAAP